MIPYQLKNKVNESFVERHYMHFWTYTKHLYLIIKFCIHTKLHFLDFTENVSAKHMVHIIQSIQITTLLLHSEDCEK